jgi:hypothetical protein
MYLLGMYIPVLCTRFLPVIQYVGAYYGMYHPMYYVLRWRYIRYSPQDLIESLKLKYSRPIQVINLFTADINRNFFQISLASASLKTAEV